MGWFSSIISPGGPFGPLSWGGGKSRGLGTVQPTTPAQSTGAYVNYLQRIMGTNAPAPTDFVTQAAPRGVPTASNVQFSHQPLLLNTLNPVTPLSSGWMGGAPPEPTEVRTPKPVVTPTKKKKKKGLLSKIVGFSDPVAGMVLNNFGI
jgi:hypothetical protein